MLILFHSMLSVTNRKLWKYSSGSELIFISFNHLWVYSFPSNIISVWIVFTISMKFLGSVLTQIDWIEKKGSKVSYFFSASIMTGKQSVLKYEKRFETWYEWQWQCTFVLAKGVICYEASGNVTEKSQRSPFNHWSLKGRPLKM